MPFNLPVEGKNSPATIVKIKKNNLINKRTREMSTMMKIEIQPRIIKIRRINSRKKKPLTALITYPSISKIFNS